MKFTLRTLLLIFGFTLNIYTVFSFSLDENYYSRVLDCETINQEKGLTLECKNKIDPKNDPVKYVLNFTGSYRPYKDYLADGFKLSCRIQYTGDPYDKREIYSDMNIDIEGDSYQLYDANEKLQFYVGYERSETQALCEVMTKNNVSIQFNTQLHKKSIDIHNSENFNLKITVLSDIKPSTTNFSELMHDYYLTCEKKQTSILNNIALQCKHKDYEDVYNLAIFLSEAAAIHTQWNSYLSFKLACKTIGKGNIEDYEEFYWRFNEKLNSFKWFKKNDFVQLYTQDIDFNNQPMSIVCSLIGLVETNYGKVVRRDNHLIRIKEYESSAFKLERQ